jgi:hypothetical protein
MCDGEPLGDRPASDIGGIEVTPEMVEAGASILMDFCRDDDPELVAAIVYRAMFCLRPEVFANT